MKTRQILALLLALLLITGILAGCGAKNSGGSVAAPMDVGYNMDAQEGLTDNNGSAGDIPNPTGLENRKWIRTVEINAETEDLTALLTQVDAKVAGLGGYTESREVRNGSAYSSYRTRYVNMTIRIPIDRLDEFVTQVSGVANVISSVENVEDVTLTYVATESRITALETEQARLLELLAQAEDMDDLLTIEARLTDVRTELEQVTSQLRLYDNLVDYGTVYLYVDEVQQLTATEEASLWQRISTGFSDSLASLGHGLLEVLVFFLTRFPYLALIAVIVLVLVLAVRYRRRKKKKGDQTKSPQDPSDQQ